MAVASAVSAWYLHSYHGTPGDLGVPAMFMRHDLVGRFAITAAEWRRGDPRALFRVFVATTLFQRRQDQQVMRILRGLTAEQVDELTSPRGLVAAADRCICPHARTQRALLGECDLTKDTNGVAVCAANPRIGCALKEHSQWLKRYGHFGKVPTSAALMLREEGVPTLGALYRDACRSSDSPRDRAVAVEAALSRVWRVSEKISAMFLSMLCNRDLSSVPPPWPELDSSYFLVIDSNTDLFLKRIGYEGPWTYAARRRFLWALSERIDLAKLKPGVERYNPRLVQQAAYLFMSRVNRRAAQADCSKGGLRACSKCQPVLRANCPVRTVANRNTG